MMQDQLDSMINERMHSEHRILQMEAIDPKGGRTNAGLIDPQLFTGEQKLHAFRGPHDNLWRLKYEHGILPSVLKQSFTSFPTLKDYCTTYFFKRGLKITGVEDVHEDSYL